MYLHAGRTSSTAVHILGLTQEGDRAIFFHTVPVLPAMRTLGTAKFKSEQLAVISVQYGTLEVQRIQYATPVKLSPRIVSSKNVVWPKPYQPYCLRWPCLYSLHKNTPKQLNISLDLVIETSETSSFSSYNSSVEKPFMTLNAVKRNPIKYKPSMHLKQQNLHIISYPGECIPDTFSKQKDILSCETAFNT